MSKNNEVITPVVFDEAAQRFEQTHGDDPAKEFRLSLDGKELIKDEYFEHAPRKVTLEDFRDPQNELQRIIKDHEATLESIRETRRMLLRLGLIRE